MAETKVNFRKIYDLYKGQENKIKEEKVKIFDTIKAKRKSLKEKINSSKTRRYFDKVTFFVSLIIIQYKSYALGRYPDYGVYLLNFILLILLYLWRNVTYRISKEHYYMFEFCYYGNLVMYFFIFLFPEWKMMYYASFAFWAGPIGWALALTGCSFVLHSVQQLTNCFIHFTPMILMWNLHWRTQYNENRGWNLYDAKKDTLTFSFIKDYYTSCLIVYLFWAVNYYILVFVILDKRIKERHYETIITYYTSRENAIGKYLKSFGENYSGLAYVITHFLVCQILFSISIVCYFSYYFHLFVIVLTSSVSFWNGASFYMDYFSKKYEINLAKLDKLHEKVGEDIINDKKKD